MYYKTPKRRKTTEFSKCAQSRTRIPIEQSNRFENMTSTSKVQKVGYTRPWRREYKLRIIYSSLFICTAPDNQEMFTHSLQTAPFLKRQGPAVNQIVAPSRMDVIQKTLTQEYSVNKVTPQKFLSSIVWNSSIRHFRETNPSDIMSKCFGKTRFRAQEAITSTIRVALCVAAARKSFKKYSF